MEGGGGKRRGNSAGIAPVRNAGVPFRRKRAPPVALPQHKAFAGLLIRLSVSFGQPDAKKRPIFLLPG